MKWIFVLFDINGKSQIQQNTKKVITCSIEKFVSLVAVTQQQVTPSIRHVLSGEILYQIKNCKKSYSHYWIFVRIQIDTRRHLIRLRIRNMCSNLLDVQQVTSRVPQQCRIRNTFFGRRFWEWMIRKYCNCWSVFLLPVAFRYWRKSLASMS